MQYYRDVKDKFVWSVFKCNNYRATNGNHALMLAPFEETIPLGIYGLSVGTYTVDVNGVQDTFDLEVDNIW